MRNERDTGPAGRGGSRNFQRGEQKFFKGDFKKGSPVGLWTFSIQKRLSGVDFGNDDGAGDYRFPPLNPPLPRVRIVNAMARIRLYDFYN